MPVRRKPAGQRPGDTPEAVWCKMTDQPYPAGTLTWTRWYLDRVTDGNLAGGMVDGAPPEIPMPLLGYWQRDRADVLEEWTAERPGTRPSCWWRWDAPRDPVGPAAGNLTTPHAPHLSGETEAGYLARFGLLLPGEADRLPPA